LSVECRQKKSEKGKIKIPTINLAEPHGSDDRRSSI
jgi:hypothetical protein